MLDHDGQGKTAGKTARDALVPTPTDDFSLPRRYADFATMTEALDYVAQSRLGMNFHDARATLIRVYPYSELRRDALAAADRFVARGIRPGERVALIAETAAEFVALFFGALYAGIWPVPLPLPTSFGGKEAYIEQLAVQLKSADPALLIYPPDLLMAGAAAETTGVAKVDWASFFAEPAEPAPRRQASAGDIAYLQYSSGSTRFPHGVVITHHALLSNLAAHAHSMHIGPGDRGVSWLPFYHDMGLVGCMLSMVANQMSVDYLKTEDFARRPLAWLDLITRNKEQSMSYSPTFGYDICARRISSQTDVAGRFDLSRWRVAGNGADMIRPDVMQDFVDTFAPAGFQARSFLPSYGLAEATLAVSVMPPGEGIVVELVEETLLAGGGPGERDRPQRYRAVVNCGKPVRGMEVAIRGDDGSTLGEREIGRVFCRGSSIMVGYFRDEEATHACLDEDLWLDTGDMGYLVRWLSLHRRPRQGHDHHQRQEPLAAGYRMGGRAAARLQGRRHRRFLDHHAGRRGDAGRPRPVPHLRRRRARPAARPDPRAGARHHRHELRDRAGPAPFAAAHQLRQAVARQGPQPLSLRRNPDLRYRGLSALRPSSSSSAEFAGPSACRYSGETPLGCSRLNAV